MPLYDRTDPTLIGFPFFFWFQLALIPVAAVLTVIAYYLSRRTADRDRRGDEPMSDIDERVAVSVFVFLFLLVTVLGFAAARWRRAERHGQPRRVGPGRPRASAPSSPGS